LVGRLDLLEKLYGNVLVPPAVVAEVLAGGQFGIGVLEFQQATWFLQTPLADPRRADLLVDLDRGEAEVIALAQEINADLVILDERLGRRHAQRLGLEITGTLGVILKGKQLGFVLEVKSLIERLQKGGIRLGRPLIARVLQLAGELP
ncbi:MAG: DUF3368 domain-containing protein, partial [Chloroflexi bacterium]|nr:DUF3368 domain-containing protein [Chloroflexota bacterium]